METSSSDAVGKTQTEICIGTGRSFVDFHHSPAKFLVNLLKQKGIAADSIASLLRIFILVSTKRKSLPALGGVVLHTSITLKRKKINKRRVRRNKDIS